MTEYSPFITNRLKDEYTTAVVEAMSLEEMKTYCTQVIALTVDLDTYEMVEEKCINEFGQEGFDEMIAKVRLLETE